jgi:hypothetical protein
MPNAWSAPRNFGIETPAPVPATKKKPGIAAGLF